MLRCRWRDAFLFQNKIKSLKNILAFKLLQNVAELRINGLNLQDQNIINNFCTIIKFVEMAENIF